MYHWKIMVTIHVRFMDASQLCLVPSHIRSACEVYNYYCYSILSMTSRMTLVSYTRIRVTLQLEKLLTKKERAGE